MEEKYQRIQIHSTDNLAQDHMLVNEEKKVVQSLMLENDIEYVVELNDEKVNGHAKYNLDLLVKKSDLGRVIKILDEYGGLGYEINLDEEIIINNEKINETSNANIEIRTNIIGIKIDKKPIKDESEYNIDPINNIDENEPIQSFDDSNSEKLNFKISIIYVVLYVIAFFSLAGYVLFR